MRYCEKQVLRRVATMSMQPTSYTVRIHQEGLEELWAEVVELPGCFASGDDSDELKQNLAEAIGLYLSTGRKRVTVELEDTADSVTERKMLVTC
jgi:predicted RNase H-like HicB family nuclease